MMTVIDMKICIKCTGCIDICPESALFLGDDAAIKCNDEKCISCGDCADFCPVDAISISD
ncbi:ATP-binding protein [Desulfobacterium sp. N47]|uniref:ATP-binding protein n=1 Tax=Desulfobacterium sp. N47 TaxID=3115210 RepID=UPI003C9F78BB